MNEPWLELRLQVPAEGVDIIAYLLTEMGSQGVVTLEQELDTFVVPDPDTVACGPQTLKAFFPPGTGHQQVLAELVTRLQPVKEAFPAWRIGPPRLAAIAMDDWAEGWKQNFHSFRVAELLVRPSWEPTPEDYRGPVMELDPGMAFGTGTHATTRLCLEALAAEIARYPACAVLDVGTGSGILAIAAAKLGAQRILACDIEPEACRIAEQNAIRNQVDTLIEVSDRPLADLEGSYQIVIANILAEENLRLAEELTARLASPGSLVLSGILAEKETAIRDGFARFELAPPRIDRAEEWLAVTYRKGG